MTENQIKLARFLIISMMGISVYQALVIRSLTHRLNYGRNQFDKLHEGAMYLFEILEKNDIELTEFDLIALTAISEGKK